MTLLGNSVDPLKPWWECTREVHILLDWLVATGRILSLEEAVDYCEKPEHWNPERETMLREEAMDRLADEADPDEDPRWAA